MLAGERGDLSGVAAKGGHERPALVETHPHCAPRSVRAQLSTLPSANSTTPGSCRPLWLTTGSAHQSFASRQLRPSSSDKYQSARARGSNEWGSRSEEHTSELQSL